MNLVIRILRISLLTLSIGFVIFLLVDAGSSLDRLGDLHWSSIIVAAALTIGAVLAAAFLWIQLVETLKPGVTRSHRFDLLRAFSRSWVARYLPGGAWSQGARFLYTEPDVVGRRVLALSLFDELALAVASATAVGITLWVWSALGIAMALVAFGILGAATIYVAMRLHRVAGWFLRVASRLGWARLRRLATSAARTAENPLGARSAAALSTGYALVSLGGGASYVFAVASLSQVSTSDVPTLMAVFILAFVVGLAAVFAPAGLGVREAVLASVGATTIAAPTAVLAAVLLRMVTMAVDILFFVVVEAIGRFRSRQAPSPLGGEGQWQRPRR